MSWTYEHWDIGKVIAHRDELGRFAVGHRHHWYEWNENIGLGELGIPRGKRRKRI